MNYREVNNNNKCCRSLDDVAAFEQYSMADERGANAND